MKEKEWFEIDNVDETDSPFLAVFPERVTANIRALKQIMPDTNRLRPHVKPHKCKQVVTLMLEEGISKFKCATIAEAEMLALAGASDVLLAFQPVGPKIKRMLSLMRSYPSTTFSCLVDNKQSADAVTALTKKKSTNVNVWLDVNTGANRTGVHPDNAFELYKSISKIKGITPVGIHAYDGYINDSDPAIRRRKCLDAFRIIEILRDEIVNDGFERPLINTGRTATVNFYADSPDIECSPGAFIYWDQLNRELNPELPFKTAALVVARVISMPGNEILCLDLGYKAISSEGSVHQRVHFLNIPNITAVAQSDEQMLINAGPDSNLNIGDTLYGAPYDIGITCNLYQVASTVYDHQLRGQWVHFIGRKLSI